MIFDKKSEFGILVPTPLSCLCMDFLVDDWFYCVCELRSMINFLGFVRFSRNFLKR